jgi:aminopeptidase
MNDSIAVSGSAGMNRINLLEDSNQFHLFLRQYASLILQLGVGFTRGEYLLVSALTVHRDLTLAIAEEAYRRGASYVNILYQDEKLQRAQLEFADAGSLSFVPQSMIAAYQELLEAGGSFISITGREDLEIFKGVDPVRHSQALLARTARLDFFYQKLYAHALKWCVAASAAPGRARIIFPTMNTDEALRALWDKIFAICKIYEDDPVKAWQRHAAGLEKRKDLLTALGIREMLLTGPECNLRVGFDPRARWKGGFGETTDNKKFLPNIPTEEVFTAPDFHTIEGHFTSTRPLTYKNICIEKLTLSFEKGELTSVEGSEGIEELKEIINTEVSHRRLGEIALVDAESAVAQSGLVYHDLLYDENALSHVALGSAYHECLFGIEALDPEEREKAGFNHSPLHIDIMLGSPSLSVTALCADGKRKKILHNGRFVL